MGALLDAVKRDPLKFARATLKRRRWKKQREIRRAFETHRLLNVHAAHGTGKTHELASIVHEWMLTRKYSRVVIGGPSHEAIKRGVWGEIRRAYDECLNRGQNLGGFMGKENWIIKDGWDASIVSVDNPNAAHGIHGPRVLVIVEEAQGVNDPQLWAAFKSLVMGPDDRMILNGNPIVPEGYFFETAALPSWHVIQIDGYEHPNVRAWRGLKEKRDLTEDEITEEWVARGRVLIPGSITRQFVYDAKVEWGLDDPRFIARVRGRFPPEGDRQLIPMSLIQSTEKLIPAVTKKRSAGLDVAFSPTGDKSVLTILDEHRVVISVTSWRGHDLIETAGKVKTAIEEWKLEPAMIAVDVGGAGAGVVHSLKHDGIFVTACDFGAGAKGSWWSLLGEEAHYPNHKTELHDLLRYYFRHKLISVPEKWRETRADLVALRYGPHRSGSISIEDKEKTRTRIGRSPDFSDSLVIALAATGYVPGVL